MFIYIYMYTYMYIYVYMYYIYTYIHIYVYIYVYICIYVLYIYRLYNIALGFLIIAFEWVVALSNSFAGVILTHAEIFQPIFSKIRKIILLPIAVNDTTHKDINNTRNHHSLFTGDPHGSSQ